MKPKVRVAFTKDGDIEACFYTPLRHRVVVDPRTGEVLSSNVRTDSDHFRWLVNAAREGVSK